MDIYLIRHTRTATVKGLCYGRSDVALADSFADEAHAVRDKLAGLNAEYVTVSSPLTRCLQLAYCFDSEAAVDQRLLEIDFGDWENRRFDALDPNQLRTWTEHFVERGPPNGESFNDVCRRAAAFWEELLSRPDAGQIVVVTHAGIIRALFVHVLQLPPAQAFRLAVDAGSVHKLRYEDGYVYVDYINR